MVTTSDNEDLLAALRLIAERAGKVVLAYYAEAESIEVRSKDNASPVTEADEAAEEAILEMLDKLTPNIPIVSEEAAAAGNIPDVSQGRFWLVDPLDGTKEFLNRSGEFTVNIALVDKGVPIAGIVHAPALAMTWSGAKADLGPAIATFSETDRPPMDIRVREVPEEGAVVVASRRHGDASELGSFLSKIKVNEMRSAGSSLKFCLVATGKADFYPRFGRTMEWDTAAGHAVLRAAGGDVATTSGEPLRYGKSEFENPQFIARGRH